METCSRTRSALALHTGGELGRGAQRAIEAHLAVCVGCRHEQAEFLQLIALSRRLDDSPTRLPESVRNRIVFEAADHIVRKSWFSSLSVPVYDFTVRSRHMTIAAAILLALIALPIAFREGAPAREHKVTTIAVEAQGGAVRLAWADGERSSYTVYKSSDPRLLWHAEVHKVRGNVWTDTNPDSSPIVFYKIE